MLVLIGRLLQGFSAGVELGGVSVYSSEMATPGHKGFYTSFQSASQQVAIVVGRDPRLSSLNPMAMPATPSPPGAGAFRSSSAASIVPFIFVLRRTLQETPAFLRHEDIIRPRREVFRSLRANWRIVVLGMMMVIMTTIDVLPHHRLHADLRQDAC